tara:strand:+ start:431 stop:754 length:324 start_codon:yes stop_codon:yes gene_type:complete
LSSAGGSCKADSAGVWWASMPFGEGINYDSFTNNKGQIESNWDALFGDRKIELIFIGQHLNKEKMIAELEDCIFTEPEIEKWNQQLFPQQDQWPKKISNILHRSFKN